MAVQATYTRGGVTLDAAYIKIHSVFGGKVEGQYGAVVKIYPNKEQADTNLDAFHTYNEYVVYADGNPYELIYADIMANIDGAVRVDEETTTE